MPLLETATTFATLVGLICNWKAERAGDATDQFQDFMRYLSEHNFKLLREEIATSADVQRELRDLLMKDSAVVSAKLDVVARGVTSLAEKLDALAPLTQALRSPTGELSSQAVDILKIFDQTGEAEMIVFRRGQFFGFLPGGGQFGLKDTRFVNDDLEMLCAFGLLHLVDHNGSGDPIYTITRQGSEFVKGKAEIRHPDGRLVGENKA